MRRFKINIQPRTFGLLLIAVVFACWFFVTLPLNGTGLPLVSPLKLPSPRAVWNAAAAVGLTQLAWQVGATLTRVFAGGIIGALVGWAIGLIMSQVRSVGQLLDPIIESVRPIPALAVFPLLILWLGIGFVAQAIVVATAIFSIIVVATYEAAIRVDHRYLLTTRNFGGDKVAEIFFILIPQTLPALIGPLRICVALAYANAIGAEFLGAQSGLGFMIRNARVTLNTAGIVLGTFLIGVLAASTDRIVRRLGKSSSHWLGNEPYLINTPYEQKF